MPLPGDASNIVGIRFESKWTALQILRVLAEDADSIRLQPPGDEGAGTEFVVHALGKTEYHQAKRQHGALKGWSISTLGGNGVLKAAFEKTAETDNLFFFTSSVSADPLMELASEARGASSLMEFKTQFLKGAKRRAWDDLMNEVRCMRREGVARYADVGSDTLLEEITFDRLKRIEVRCQDEVSLAESLDFRLRSLIRGDTELARATLESFARENVHRTLHADEIWAFLERAGFRRADFSTDRSVLAAVEDLNRRYETLLCPIRHDVNIERSETGEVWVALTEPPRRKAVLISGSAGVGKSVVIGQIMRQARELRVPFLYFRADRLNPTELPADVGRQLGLPASPVEVLAGIAKGRGCILILDQLDAVSSVSGRNPELFNCLDGIARQVRLCPNVSLLVACRKFDVDRDLRLRRLSVAEDGVEICVQPFTAQQVQAALHLLGIEFRQLDAKQLSLLRLPLHLALFAQTATAISGGPWRFRSAVQLFDAYWENMRSRVENRLKPLPPQWMEVIDVLCDEMTRRQSLSVGEFVVLDRFTATVRAMESEHLLVLDGTKVGFFHESFFDYAFARLFVQRGGHLMDYLVTGEQHLFKRAPMRQVLAHESATDPRVFVRDVQDILGSSVARSHIKKAVVELLAQLDQPSPELWSVLSRHMAGDDAFVANELWRMLAASPNWFAYLDEIGFWAARLEGLDWTLMNPAVLAMHGNVAAHPDRVVRLVGPKVGASTEWNLAVLNILWRAPGANHRPLFDLLLRLVDRGAFDEGSGDSFWHCLSGFADKQPAWSSEAVARFLERRLCGSELTDSDSAVLKDQNGLHIIPKLAARTPAAFVTSMTPLFLRLVEAGAEAGEDGLIRDRFFGYRMYKEHHFRLNDAILSGMVESLAGLAKSDAEAFRASSAALVAKAGYDSVNFVLISAMSRACEALLGEAAQYVAANPRRLECGWVGGSGGDYQYWAGREFVGHISISCSDSDLRTLESAIVGHTPERERSPAGLRSRGWFHYTMLSAIPPGRLGTCGKAAIGECERKFPRHTIRPPVGFEMRAVGSPIPEEAAARMTDSQWLAAMSKYKTDDAWSRHDEEGNFRGGPHQLSRIMEAEAKRNPDRFVDLLRRFPDDAHASYVDAIFMALRDADVAPETVWKAIRTARASPGSRGGHWLLNPIARFADQDVPDDILEIVASCATESDDPQPGEFKVRSHRQTDENMAHDLINTSINSVRGVASETIARLIFSKPDRLRRFGPSVARMAEDPATSVRSTVAHTLLAVFATDRCEGSRLFTRLCAGQPDILLATPHVEDFIWHAAPSQPVEVLPIIERMVRSEVAFVRRVGARQACLACFHHPRLRGLVDACLAGDKEQRTGGAEVAAANLFAASGSEFSRTTLPGLFCDSEKEVRDVASSCFRRARGGQLGTCRDLIEAFVASPALMDNIYNLTLPLKESTEDLSVQACILCERLASELAAGAGAGLPRAFHDVSDAAELVMRAYRQSDDEGYRSRCLDVMDRLLRAAAYGIEEQLAEFER